MCEFQAGGIFSAKSTRDLHSAWCVRPNTLLLSSRFDKIKTASAPDVCSLHPIGNHRHWMTQMRVYEEIRALTSRTPGSCGCPEPCGLHLHTESHRHQRSPAVCALPTHGPVDRCCRSQNVASDTDPDIQALHVCSLSKILSTIRGITSA